MPSRTPPAVARLAPRRPDRFALLLAAIAALGAGLVLARSAADGVFLRGDSIHYVSMARSLLDGDGLLPWWGEPAAYWAPLFPAALVIAGFGVFDPLDAAGPLNAAAFGLTILVAGRWMRRRLASRFLAARRRLAIAFSVPVAGAAGFAWSEPLFILFVTLSLSETDAWLETGRRSAVGAAAGGGSRRAGLPDALRRPRPARGDAAADRAAARRRAARGTSPSTRWPRRCRSPCGYCATCCSPARSPPSAAPPTLPSTATCASRSRSSRRGCACRPPRRPSPSRARC